MDARFRARARGSSALLAGALVALPVGLVAALVLWPIALSVIDTLVVTGPDGTRPTLAAYARFFADDYSVASLGITLWTTAVSVAILLGLSLPLALYLRFATGRLAAAVQGLTLLPLFVPSIILAYALIRTLGPNGTVDTLLNAAGLPKIASPYLTPWGPVIGLVWDNLPLTVLIVLAGFANVSRTSVEAARDVGAGPVTVLLRIVLPRIYPSLTVAMSFVVLGLFSAFTLPYLLGPAAPEMLGPFMQRTFGDVNDPLAARVQAVVTFGCCAVFGALYVRATARGRDR